MSKIIGIDLGTTNSLVAYLAEDGPHLIPNALGEVLTPSVVGIDQQGKLLVGMAAKELRVMHPERCAWLFKRHMGSDWKASLQGRNYSAEELSSLVLRSLKADAEAFFGEPIERAVITVPAYFNDQQRKATINAGRIVGLKVERTFNEPTAASLLYGFHELKEDKILLILDLGGGTFDVSVVELFEGTLEVRASSGESFLGGEDFTRSLAARVLEQQGFPFERTEMEYPHLVSRMMQQCEGAKCKLTQQESVTVRLPNKKGIYQDDAPQVTVTRVQFESWSRPILSRIDMPIRRVLSDAKLRKEDVHEVILVGGATRMPQVIERVRELLDKTPQQRWNPDEVVALGAAIQAGLIDNAAGVEDLAVTDVAPFTLGIAISKQFGHEQRDGYFLPVIHRNTTIPVSHSEVVSTLHANQKTVIIRIYQGESRRVEDNLLLGEFEVQGIPPGPAGQGIEVRFTYDLNGVLEVEATIVATKKMVSHLVTRYARGLSNEQIRKAVADMAKLKTHPREEAENRLLLQWAERVYAELPMREREYLGGLLDGFEEALSTRDAANCAQMRDLLREFLNLHSAESELDADEGSSDAS